MQYVEEIQDDPKNKKLGSKVLSAQNPKSEKLDGLDVGLIEG
jgi:hypothetical protein